MLNALKSKFNANHITYDEKIQSLTHMPESWSRNKTVSFLGRSSCLAYACMIHRCPNCSEIDGLLSKLDEIILNLDADEPMQFQQWQSLTELK